MKKAKKKARLRAEEADAVVGVSGPE